MMHPVVDHHRNQLQHNIQSQLLHMHRGPDPSGQCRGYWQSLSNVERELRAWMRVHRLQGALPTSVQLREAGAWSLMYAVRLHGPRKLAARLG